MLVISRAMIVPVALIEKDRPGDDLKVLVFRDGLVPKYVVRLLGSLLARHGVRPNACRQSTRAPTCWCADPGRP